MSVIERMLGRPDGPGDDNNGSLTIAPMRKRDLRQGILDTEAHAYPTPWSPGVFQSEIDQVAGGSRYYLTARRSSGTASGSRRSSKGRIVGHAGLWFTLDEAHVTNVAVHPDARRTGVATALMLALAEEAIRRECTAWTLEVRVSSDGAQELYRNFGFVPAGVRKNYYENVEDAIVMWCHDIQHDAYRRRLDRLGATR
ncbi:MAG: ribosomal protein S18-alanine N-acetyltransferase [Ilumatobacter sp.]|uniref:ribosomal protein S18-alanine N-acetyltransferase n=2 Tax=Ilumatobacter sp. TaxID=1967498 RepID=UPI0032990DC4